MGPTRPGTTPRLIANATTVCLRRRTNRQIRNSNRGTGPVRSRYPVIVAQFDKLSQKVRKERMAAVLMSSKSTSHGTNLA